MRKILLMLSLWTVSWAASAQINPPINLLKLSGDYVCQASAEPQEITEIQAQAREEGEQRAQSEVGTQEEAPPQPVPSQTESPTESEETARPETQEGPKPPLSRRLTVKMLLQSAGYPVINLENEFLQISGRAVQIVDKANRDVAFILNGGGLGSFALHIAQARGPVTAKLWRIDQETFTTTLYRYNCVKR